MNKQIQHQGGTAVPFTYTEEQQLIFDAIIDPTSPVLSIKATAG